MTLAQATQTEVIYRFNLPYPSQLEEIKLGVGDRLLKVDGSGGETIRVLTMSVLCTMGAFPSSGKILEFWAKAFELAENQGITIKKSPLKPLFPKGKRILEITKFDETGLFVKVIG